MKRIISFVICLTMILASLSALASCGNTTGDPVDKPEKTYYSVAVDGGTGAGKYYEGNICQVTAVVPEGKQFMKWLKNGQEVSVNETYAFEVTENSRLVAVFADAVANADKKVYLVSTINAVGGGGYFEGASCTLKTGVKDDDKSFKGWAPVVDGVVGEILSTEREYTFTVSGDVTVKAIFNDVPLATPDNSNNAMFDLVAGQPRIEYDKQTDENGKRYTAFVEGVAYIKIYIYTSDAEDAEPIGYLKMVQNPDKTAYFENMQGEIFNISGEEGNYFTPDGNTHNWFKNSITAMGHGSYSPNITYYFATQAVAVEEEINGYTYCDSAISAKGRGVKNM